jgi:hypothetical protein
MLHHITVLHSQRDKSDVVPLPGNSAGNLWQRSARLSANPLRPGPPLEIRLTGMC